MRSKYREPVFLIGIVVLFFYCFSVSCGAAKGTIGKALQKDDLTGYFFSTIEADHLENPGAIYYREDLTAADIPGFRQMLWTQWKKANSDRLATWAELPEKGRIDSVLWSLPTQKKALFALYKKGNRPPDGYPLYINLHGGGTLPEAKMAWGASFNDEEWKAAKYLGGLYKDSPSLYFIPRMADDRRGRWYHRGEQTEFIRAWQLGVLSGDVNPDKTYILGISEGGYGSFRMGPFFADYFAAAGPMAGVSFTNEAPIENMRNTPFRITVGEFDYAYGRAAAAAQWKISLDSASAGNPGQFIHVVDVERGRGHGVDYFQTAPWLAQFTRNPYPDTLSFQYYAVHDTVFGEQYDTSYTYRKGFGYIRLDGLTASVRPLPGGLLQTGVRNFYVEKKGNTYHILSNNRIGTVSGTITVYLDKVNLLEPVKIYYNGHLAYNKKVQPNAGVMAETLALFGDPRRIFAAKAEVRIE
jgi:hypothetical protein